MASKIGAGMFTTNIHTPIQVFLNFTNTSFEFQYIKNHTREKLSNITFPILQEKYLNYHSELLLM